MLYNSGLRLDDPALRREAVDVLMKDGPLLGRPDPSLLVPVPCRKWMRAKSATGVATWRREEKPQPRKLAKVALKTSAASMDALGAEVNVHSATMSLQDFQDMLCPFQAPPEEDPEEEAIAPADWSQKKRHREEEFADAGMAADEFNKWLAIAEQRRHESGVRSKEKQTHERLEVASVDGDSVKVEGEVQCERMVQVSDDSDDELSIVSTQPAPSANGNWQQLARDHVPMVDVLSAPEDSCCWTVQQLKLDEVSLVGAQFAPSASATLQQPERDQGSIVDVMSASNANAGSQPQQLEMQSASSGVVVDHRSLVQPPMLADAQSPTVPQSRIDVAPKILPLFPKVLLSTASSRSAVAAWCTPRPDRMASQTSHGGQSCE